ncbi:Signal transduction histidine kinase [Desulforamulus aeronauticus DSM 10349]|uniref:histidine kinase n=2 Tax=Desulforamulus aeronauticus TaxID=53343 RepID=A0A1M6WJN5_9FIRM|nr:Signal transduction histidine kinase [Desulforamulus aeronauticus DSM 10349]
MFTLSEMLFENHFSHYAPAARLPMNRVLEQYQAVSKIQEIHSVLDALPNVIMILNQQRQLVYCNQALFDLLNIDSPRLILGGRPGEILTCVHACENEAGCGTSEACSTCGAVLALLTGLGGQKNSQECRITVRQGDELVALDLLISATPFELEEQNFVIVQVNNISDEKRRQVLEKIFFHDIINTAGSLRGIVELLGYIKDPHKKQELMQDLEEVSDSLIEEILGQRDLVSAENNELVVQRATVETKELLSKVVDQFAKHPVAQGIALRLSEDAEVCYFQCDPVLLKRIVGNMIKNALEASRPGDIVKVGAARKDQQVEIWVSNSQVMSKQVQLQVFKRSFSTKGKGRGLGTYSMKLLTERYLKGSISFQVSETAGTTFRASFPLEMKE